MTLETRSFEAHKYISTPDAVADLLNDALAAGHCGYIAAAVDVAARAKAARDVATEFDPSGQALDPALSGREDITLDTLLKIIGSLGLQLEVKPKEEARVE